MRLIISAMLIGFGAASARAQTGPVDQAGWLAGCWEQRTPTRVTVEMWMSPLGGAMLGASRTVVSGRLREFEFLRLTARGDTVVYTAMPSGQNTTEFRATAVTAEQLRFENRAHDFPQVITYRRASADSVVARVEGPGPNNSTRGIDFPMRRVSCTDANPAR